MAKPTLGEVLNQALTDLARAVGATSYHVCGGPSGLDECIHEHQAQWQCRRVPTATGWVERYWCPICAKWRA